MAYCIENDISVWRTYWDERESSKRAYCIDWKTKRCEYTDTEYWKSRDIDVEIPNFYIDQYGRYQIGRSIT
ncbi:MAG: hypothetical protein J1E81_06005 [Eubacterium sp.]|nr:hypothetical protein [Eubacterium sp.]